MWTSKICGLVKHGLVKCGLVKRGLVKCGQVKCGLVLNDKITNIVNLQYRKGFPYWCRKEREWKN